MHNMSQSEATRVESDQAAATRSLP